MALSRNWVSREYSPSCTRGSGKREEGRERRGERGGEGEEGRERRGGRGGEREEGRERRGERGGEGEEGKEGLKKEKRLSKG